MNICLYRCFDSDQRLSMDIYAETLMSALQSHSMNVSMYRPSSPLERYHNNLFVMRYLRYIHYPKQVVKLNSPEVDVHHVIDHGYAHLHPSFKGKNSIVTVHDLIPLLNWKGLINGVPRSDSGSLVKRPRLNIHSISYIHRYNEIIAVSKSTADDIHSHLGVPYKNISIVPPVVDAIFRPSSNVSLTEFRRKYGFDKATKYILISGGEFYKNHQTCLKVLSELVMYTDQKIELVKMGYTSEHFDGLAYDIGVDSHVRSIYLPDRYELPLLYGVVDCLLFPSLYEGFGMPVAEALACGTPVVVSNRGSLPEVVGDLTKPIDALDVGELTKAVLNCLSGYEIERNVKYRGINSMKKYRSSAVLDKLSNVYQRLI